LIDILTGAGILQAPSTRQARSGRAVAGGGANRKSCFAFSDAENMISRSQ